MVKIIGAAYLVYLGIKLWRDGKAISIDSTASQPVSRARLFRQAFFVSVTNPKALVLIAALIPPFVDRTQPMLPQVAIMSVSYAGICFANHLMLARPAASCGGSCRRRSA